MCMKKNSGEKFSLSSGEKAFICQQASDLQMPALILMERAVKRADGGGARKASAKGPYIATFVLDPDNLNLKARGRGDTVVEACIEAKRRAKESFARAAGFFPDKPRELLIDLIKRKQPLN